MTLLDKIDHLSAYTNNIRVLYAEDEPIAREMIADLLRDIFDDVSIAADGEEALEIFRTNYYDLVITDITMPKLNGLDLIEKIKRINPNTKTIILSQNNKSHFFLESIKLKVDGYVLKPVEFEQLIDMITKVVVD